MFILHQYLYKYKWSIYKLEKGSFKITQAFITGKIAFIIW